MVEARLRLVLVERQVRVRFQRVHAPQRASGEAVRLREPAHHVPVAAARAERLQRFLPVDVVAAMRAEQQASRLERWPLLGGRSRARLRHL
eukprot:7381073-Prymnesium_polylepis.1